MRRLPWLVVSTLWVERPPLSFFLEEFAIYLNYVRKLGFEEAPDYDFLRDLFAKALRQNGDADDGMFDWLMLNGGKGIDGGSVCARYPLTWLDSQSCSQATANILNNALPTSPGGHRSRQRSSQQPGASSPNPNGTATNVNRREFRRGEGLRKPSGLDINIGASTGRGAPSPLMVNPPGTGRRLSNMGPGQQSPMHPYATAGAGTTGGMHVPSTMGTAAGYGHVRGATAEEVYARAGSALGSARVPGGYGSGNTGRGPTTTGVNGIGNPQAVAQHQHSIGVAGGIGGNAGEDRKEKRGFWAVLCCR